MSNTKIKSKLNFEEFDLYNQYLPNDEARYLFSGCYRKMESFYELSTHLDISDLETLRFFYEFHINKEENSHYYNREFLAYYIYKERRNAHRHGEREDDYFKAEYILQLNNYLRYKRGQYAFDLDDPIEREEVIWMAFNIFDTAFFNKLNNKGSSDEECFLLAEREFCEQKELDWLAYMNYLHRREHQLPGDAQGDYALAVDQHKRNRTRQQAYYIWQKRVEKGIPGDKEKDWLIARECVEDEDMKETLARISWDIGWTLSPRPSANREHYWYTACEVLKRMKARKMDGSKINLYRDKWIFREVKEILLSAPS